MADRIERKLTTILAADAVGYSRAMAADETAALEALRAARAVFARLVERHRGRIFSRAGDGLLAEFASVVEAVQAAVEVQQELANRKTVAGATPFRIGIHLGDVMVDGDDLFGDGVNLAARLQAMAEPGGVLVSQPVYDQVWDKLSIRFDYLGERRPKNLAEDVAVYRITLGGRGRGAGEHRSRASKNSPKPDHEARRRPHQSDSRPSARDHLRRHGARLGIIWLGLLAVDLLSGPGFWAHWPGVAFLAFLGLKAVPVYVAGRFHVQLARFALIVAFLTLINLLTWNGTLWVVWPALALVVLELLRRTRPHSS